MTPLRHRPYYLDAKELPALPYRPRVPARDRRRYLHHCLQASVRLSANLRRLRRGLPQR